jgi:tetratricopeptide (TPR) repeat protein
MFPFPLTIGNLRRLLPDVNWDSDVPTLKRRGLIAAGKNTLRVPEHIRKEALRRPGDRRPLLRTWITALEPLRVHPDLAICLSLLYLENGELVKAVRILAEAAESLDPGWLNDLCCVGLSKYNNPNVHRKLSLNDRMRLLNSNGICLSRRGDCAAAMAVFKTLRSLATRRKHSWGLGQAYLNGGVALEQCGDRVTSIEWLRRAVMHARATRNAFLLGRALSDLAISVGPNSPDEARRLLKETREIKRKVHDRLGQIGYHMAQGMITVWEGRQSDARRHFQRAGRLAEKHCDQHGHANALLNLGSASFERNAGITMTRVLTLSKLSSLHARRDSKVWKRMRSSARPYRESVKGSPIALTRRLSQRIPRSSNVVTMNRQSLPCMEQEYASLVRRNLERLVAFSLQHAELRSSITSAIGPLGASGTVP